MLTQKAEVIPPAYGSTASRETGIRTCGSISGLAAIGAPSTELVIWKRALPSQLRDWLNQIPVPVLPDLRLLIKPGELRPALEPLLEQCGITAGDMHDLFIADIGELVQVFSDITASARVDVRLERVDARGHLLDGQSGRLYAKKFKIGGVTRDKEYNLFKPHYKSRVFFFTVHDSEKGNSRVLVHIDPSLKRVKEKVIEFDFDWTSRTPPSSSTTSTGCTAALSSPAFLLSIISEVVKCQPYL